MVSEVLPIMIFTCPFKVRLQILTQQLLFPRCRRFIICLSTYNLRWIIIKADLLLKAIEMSITSFAARASGPCRLKGWRTADLVLCRCSSPLWISSRAESAIQSIRIVEVALLFRINSHVSEPRFLPSRWYAANVLGLYVNIQVKSLKIFRLYTLWRPFYRTLASFGLTSSWC